MDCLITEPQRAARAEARLPSRLDGGNALVMDLDHEAVERVRLYIRCLDLAENTETTRLLSQTVQQAERRLRASGRVDPAAVLLDELHRLLPAGRMEGEPAPSAALTPIPVPTPPPCPRHMIEQRLDYLAPMRALCNLVLGLVDLVFPRSRRYGQ